MSKKRSEHKRQKAVMKKRAKLKRKKKIRKNREPEIRESDYVTIPGSSASAFNSGFNKDSFLNANNSNASKNDSSVLNKGFDVSAWQN